MRKLIFYFLIAALSFTFSTTALAQETSDEKASGRNIELEELPEEERKLLLERSKVVESYIWEIEKAHATLRELKNQLSKSSDSDIQNELSLKIKDAEDELIKARENTTKYGLIKLKPVKEQSKASILSSAGNFTITENYILYDSVVGKYLHHTAGNWTNDNWKSDYFCGVCFAGWKDLGGTNGYYLASLHEPINTYNRKFHTLLYSDWSSSIDWSSSASTYSTSNGFGWEFQDRVKLEGLTLLVTTDFNADRQLGWYWFDFVNGRPNGKTISFKVDAGHSWSSTTLSGIGIGPYTFSFAWSSTSNSWNKNHTVSYTF